LFFELGRYGDAVAEKAGHQAEGSAAAELLVHHNAFKLVPVAAPVFRRIADGVVPQVGNLFVQFPGVVPGFLPFIDVRGGFLTIGKFMLTEFPLFSKLWQIRKYSYRG